MNSIFKWMIVLLLLIAVAGGGGIYWYYVRSDELLRIEVLEQLSNLAPGLRFSVERANFDFSGRVRIYGLSVQLPGDVEPALEIPEAVLTLDKDQLTDFQKISVERVRLVHPRLRVVKQLDGTWDWQGIAFKTNPAQLLPHFELEHGTVVLELEHERGPVRKLKLVDLNVMAAPAAARKISGMISARVDSYGPLSVTLETDLDGPNLNLEAKWLKLPVDENLFALISEFSPAVQAQLQQARRAMGEIAARQIAASPIPDPGQNQVSAVGPLPTGMAGQSQQTSSLQTDPTSFGLKCDCDLHLKFRRRAADEPPFFEVLAEIRTGQVSNPLLPFPLYEIQGSVYADSRQFVFRDFRAQNGAIRLNLGARLAPGQRPTGKLQVRNLPIDDPLKARLPESMRKLLNSIWLEGVCDVDLATIQRNGELVVEGDLLLSQGVVSHEKFRYPIRDVSGTASLRGNTIELNAVGKASGVPVRLTGTVVNPGPENESNIVIQAVGIPINSTFIEACQPPVQRAILDLDLQGDQDAWVRIWKLPGAGQRFNIQSRILLKNCSMYFKGFPYRINRLQGELHTNEEVIVFKELKGQHDATLITGSGTYYRLPAPGRLELNLQAENAAFDRSLQAALPDSVRRTWEEFQPTGRFDAAIKIDWVPGQPCHIALPQVSVTDTEITIRSFPWPLQGVSGQFSYENSLLTIKTVSAHHDDTQLHARGYANFTPGEPWHVRFDELHVDDLAPNSTFRKALPPQLAKVFETLNPTGKFSIETTRPDRLRPNRQRQGWLELSGGGPDANSLTITWDVQLILAECALTAGIRIDDIHGRIDLAGVSAGQNTSLNGQLDLDSVSIFRQPGGQAHQIARVVGPIKYVNGAFTAGSQTMSAPTSEHVPESAQICADVIDGKLHLNVVANLQSEPAYRIGLALIRGKLETYAQQYLRGQSNLAGIMNGWLFLWGKGTSADQIHGKGQLVVAPAALYELPLFVQIFRVLRPDSGDRTAFDRADVNFNIENSRFNFEIIDLVGTTFSLRGRGYVRFDGAMQLNFYSMLARNRIPIPLVREFVGAISRGWVGVKVTGTVGSPSPPQIVPVPELDEAIKQFLGSFDPVPMRPAGRPVGRTAN